MNRSRNILTVLTVFFAGLLCSTGISYAECVKRPLTAGEQTYYEQVTNVMEEALPAPEGWRRQVNWMNVPEMVCEGFEKNPVIYGGQFKFKEITEVDRIKEEMAQKQKALEDKILEASRLGDFSEVSRLQGEMQRVVSENLERLRKAQEEAQSGPKPLQMIAKFKVNDKRKAIGKKFEVPAMANTAKTFETVNAQGTERETVSKILLVGSWRVEDFIKNWNLLRPDVPYDAIGGIHLKITGKRQQLEAYLASKVDLGLLKSAAR